MNIVEKFINVDHITKLQTNQLKNSKSELRLTSYAIYSYR